MGYVYADYDHNCCIIQVFRSFRQNLTPSFKNFTNKINSMESKIAKKRKIYIWIHNFVTSTLWYFLLPYNWFNFSLAFATPDERFPPPIKQFTLGTEISRNIFEDNGWVTLEARFIGASLGNHSCQILSYFVCLLSNTIRGEMYTNEYV